VIAHLRLISRCVCCCGASGRVWAMLVSCVVLPHRAAGVFAVGFWPPRIAKTLYAAMASTPSRLGNESCRSSNPRTPTSHASMRMPHNDPSRLGLSCWWGCRSLCRRCSPLLANRLPPASRAQPGAHCLLLALALLILVLLDMLLLEAFVPSRCRAQHLCVRQWCPASAWPLLCACARVHR